MFCPGCAASNHDLATFCSACGAPLPRRSELMPAGLPTLPTTSALAITGFVLAFFIGVVGLVLSILGLRACRKSEGRIAGAGLAIAGIAVGVLNTLCYLALLA
jgi:hypothetical protein